MVLTEIVAYQHLADRWPPYGRVSVDRTLLILSYALCGFTHVASVGIFVGGVSRRWRRRRRNDLAVDWGLEGAGLGATLATLMTGALAGLFYHGQQGACSGSS